MLKIILYLLSTIYGLVTTIRNKFYDWKIFKTYKVNVPVISIGNFTVGGNAKTPIAEIFYKKFTELKYDPVILMKGYKAKISSPTLVNKNHCVDEIGDEAYLLGNYKNCKVVIANNKLEGANFIEKNKLANIIILDDGLQHRKLVRDLNIICLYFKNIDQLHNSKLLPYGPCREFATQALKRADALIIATREINAKFPKVDLSIPCYHSFISKYEIISTSNNKVANLNEAVAFCALANPEGFFSTLEQIGIKLIEKITFKDHYKFNKSDIENIRAKFPNIALICSEKDLVKILNYNLNNIYVLKIVTEIKDIDKLIP